MANEGRVEFKDRGCIDVENSSKRTIVSVTGVRGNTNDMPLAQETSNENEVATSEVATATETSNNETAVTIAKCYMSTNSAPTARKTSIDESHEAANSVATYHETSSPAQPKLFRAHGGREPISEEGIEFKSPQCRRWRSLRKERGPTSYALHRS